MVDKVSKNDGFEFDVEERNLVFIQRKFLGKSERDIEIEALPIPSSPMWLRIFIKMIRFYQKRISRKLGNRCVFNPSCSHYSELAFRKKGLIKGVLLTVGRLYRCKPKNGGTDDIK